MATKTKLVKLSLYAKRKTGLTEDEFHRNWAQGHRAITADWLAKYGVVKYTQVSELSACEVFMSASKAAKT